MSKLVNGIGTNEGKCLAVKDGKPTKEYRAWRDMLFRCTEKCWIKNPSYIGTTCSENFKNYSYFYEWCQTQVGFGNKDEKDKIWHLDKDILLKGNKHYSEDTCVFVAKRVNLLLTKSDASRGCYPIGVYWIKSRDRFRSLCGNGIGKLEHLGYFDTEKEAFLAYKTFKEALIKEVANEYKEQLDERAYEALMKYEVNVDD